MARALAAQGEFERELELLRYPPEGSDAILIQVLKAQVFRELDRKPEETSAWRQALLIAQNNLTRNEFLRIARFASEAGNQSIVADALVGASSHPLGDLPAAEEIRWLTNYLVENERLGDLETVNQRLLARSGDPALMNNALYLSAIAGEGANISEGMIETAEQLAKQFPQYPQMRSTLALLYVLEDRNAEALAAYRESERSGIGWHQFSPAGRATLALVLARNGPIEPFANVAVSIKWSGMTVTERRFFRTRLDRYLATSGGELREAEIEEPGVSGDSGDAVDGDE